MCSPSILGRAVFKNRYNFFSFPSYLRKIKYKLNIKGCAKCLKIPFLPGIPFKISEIFLASGVVFPIDTS